MNQQWLIDHVLETGRSLPTAPGGDAEYLTLAEAEAIVDEALEALGAHGDPTEYTYMRGHRKRLMHALSMIPKASDRRRTLLDVGCYGYMGLWAIAHLGYERVVGIEWHPEIDQPVIEQELQVGEASVRFSSHNFDITDSDWPLDEQFDTVLFFEVLEHVNEDPMGVMERINGLMRDDATLVMSVPNAISYKVIREFMVGMPPWTYWFFQPDLGHEPRHCFEYTPIVFQSLLIASGMTPNAFRTIYAYSTPEQEREILEIASGLGFGAVELGETMIAHATKSRSGVPLRYPDVLYSPDGYYKNIYPRLQSVFQQRVDGYRANQQKLQHKPVASEIEQKPNSQATDELLRVCDEYLHQQEVLEQQLSAARTEITRSIDDRDAQRAWAEQLATKSATLETQVNELLFQSDCRLQRERELAEQAEQANSSMQQAKRELHDTKSWAERLSGENAQLRAQVNELLFACDCYLQQLNDPTHCVRVIRQKRFRWALDRTKSVARKTPIVRTAMRPVYRSAKRFIKRRM